MSPTRISKAQVKVVDTRRMNKKILPQQSVRRGGGHCQCFDSLTDISLLQDLWRQNSLVEFSTIMRTATSPPMGVTCPSVHGKSPSIG